MTRFPGIAASPGRKDTERSASAYRRSSTVAYIRSQPEHHRRMTFQEEFRKFLKKHGIEYDERYVWG